MLSLLSRAPSWARLGSGLALVVAALGMPAQATTVMGSVTSLTSLTQRMISYRHQEHMWQTPDGGLHVMVNRGKTSNSLTLYSSHDAGASWTLQQSLNGTGSINVSDGAWDEATGTLTVVHDTSAGDVAVVALAYDAAAHTWTAGKSQTLPRESGFSGANPSFVTDSKGNSWVAFVTTETATQRSTIALYRRAAGKTKWSNTGLSFGPFDALSPPPQFKRSARLVRTPAGVGVVYTVREAMYWSERPAKGAASLPWTPAAAPLYESPYPPDEEPVSSHFSTVVDGKGYIHMSFADGGALMYQRYDAKTLAWSNVSTLVPASSGAQATYSQMIWLGNKNIAIVANNKASARVYQASDRGDLLNKSFACTHLLNHAVSNGHQDYTLPRLEAPGTVIYPPTQPAAVPVLQQFVDNTSGVDVQRALSFQFGQASGADCK